MPFVRARCFTTGLVLLLATSLAHAQDQPVMPPDFTFDFAPMGGMGGPGGPGGQSLAMSPAVQEDLKLSDKQKAQLKRLQGSAIQKAREAFAAAQEGGVEPQEMMEGMAGLRREHESAVSKVLDKAQKARLAQIELQREGLLAVTKPDVATKIKLTSPQSRKVKTILSEMRQAQFRGMPTPPGGGGPPGAGAFPGGGPPGGRPDFNSEEFRAQLVKVMDEQKKIRAASTQKIAEILTKDQTAAFEKLLGEPFDLAKLNAGPPTADPPSAAAPSAEAETPKSETPKKDAPAKTQPKSKSRKNQTP